MELLGRIIDKLEETLIVLLLAFMAGMNFVNVISRYCFTNSFSFTEELTIMAFVWVTMLGIATGYKRSAHLGMSFVVGRFSKKGQAVFVIFSMLCSLVMIIMMIKYGFEMVQGQIMLNSVTPALQIPSCAQGLAVPVGGIFIVIRTIQSSFMECKRLWNESFGTEGGEGAC